MFAGKRCLSGIRRRGNWIPLWDPCLRRTPFCESKNVKIVLQTSKESDLKTTKQEQTEEKYVTNRKTQQKSDSREREPVTGS
jgi:hypothetical protein